MFTSDNEQGLHNGAVDGGMCMTSVVTIYRLYINDYIYVMWPVALRKTLH